MPTIIICFILLTSLMISNSRKSTTNENSGLPSKRWVTLFPPEKPTPSTDSWDEVYGFDKIRIKDPQIEEDRGELEDKYYCKRDDKKVRRGFHYFDSDNCLVWHCPRWPIPVGVYDFEYYNCTEIEVRLWPLYHKECRIHRCKTKRINLTAEYTLPTVPLEWRTVKPFPTGGVFRTHSDESSWTHPPFSSSENDEPSDIPISIENVDYST